MRDSKKKTTLLPTDLRHPKVQKRQSLPEDRFSIWIADLSSVQNLKPRLPTSLQTSFADRFFMLSIEEDDPLQKLVRCYLSDTQNHIVVLTCPESLLKKAGLLKNLRPHHRTTGQCHIAIQKKIIRVARFLVIIGWQRKKMLPILRHSHCLTVHHPKLRVRLEICYLITDLVFVKIVVTIQNDDVFTFRSPQSEIQGR